MRTQSAADCQPYSWNRANGAAIGLAACVVLACALAPSQETSRAGSPDADGGPGIAARYPGDRRIDSDPRVILAENFEHDALEQIHKRWESVQSAEQMALDADRPPASAGRQSLRMTHVGGEGDGGYLYRRLPPGHEKRFVRFYVKFDRDCAPIHHFFHVGGYNPSTPYPQGGAGVRPRGNERFTVGIEPHGDTWTWDYYAYWMEMRGSPPRGQTWGNSFIRDPESGSGRKEASDLTSVKRGEWICVETLIQLNDVGESDGELALWIDGNRVSHVGPGFPSGKWVYDKFLPGEGGDGVRWNDARRGPEYFTVPAGGQPFEGFRWRSDEQLKLNFLWVLLYITDAPDGHVSRVWFDDIVVATEYIGPLTRADTSEPPPK